MNVWFKQGVFGDLSIVCQKAFGRVANLYTSKGLDLFCTSIRDGNHSKGSLHYIGNAFDIKRKGVSAYEIAKALGRGFDVVEYTDERDIFHIEFDPK